MRTGGLMAAAFAALALLCAVPAGAQSQPPAQQRPQIPCGAGMVENTPDLLHRATFRRTDVEANHVRLTFAGHSTFLVETPQGAKLITDYNDFVRLPDRPDIITMNTGHSTHSTENIPAGIRYVLRGWDPAGGIAHHDVTFKDLRVYNVPTNIETFGGGPTATSSIFMIQAAGLCIAHLGNIHHVIDDERIQHMGRVDIALVPVDRFVTNTYDETLYNLQKMKPKLIVPMHLNYLGPAQDFAARAAGIYKSKISKTNAITVSRASLPQTAEILILRPPVGGRPGGDGI